LGGAAEDGVEAFVALEFAEAELAAGVLGEGSGDVLAADEALSFGTGFRVEFGAKLALGLEARKVLGGAAEVVAGMGAGAVDGVEAGLECGVGREAGFGEGAAAEPPCGMQDFGGVGALEGRGGAEFGFEIGAEFVVFGLFVGEDEVAGREEAVGGGVESDFSLCPRGCAGRLRIGRWRGWRSVLRR
jgi:hypothetical protein